MDIIWSNLALQDLKEIAHYVSDNFGDKVAHASIEKLQKKVNSLKLFPESGILDRKLSSKNYSVHRLIVIPNVIYYLLEADSIVVMTIVHTRRSARFVNSVLKRFLEHYEQI